MDPQGLGVMTEFITKTWAHNDKLKCTHTISHVPDIRKAQGFALMPTKRQHKQTQCTQWKTQAHTDTHTQKEIQMAFLCQIWLWAWLLASTLVGVSFVPSSAPEKMIRGSACANCSPKFALKTHFLQVQGKTSVKGLLTLSNVSLSRWLPLLVLHNVPLPGRKFLFCHMNTFCFAAP